VRACVRAYNACVQCVRISWPVCQVVLICAVLGYLISSYTSVSNIQSNIGDTGFRTDCVNTWQYSHDTLSTILGFQFFPNKEPNRATGSDNQHFHAVCLRGQLGQRWTYEQRTRTVACRRWTFGWL